MTAPFQVPQDPRRAMRGRDFQGAIALVILTMGAGAPGPCWAENELNAVAYLQDPGATKEAKRAMLAFLGNQKHRGAPSPIEPHTEIYGVLVHHYDGDYWAALEALAAGGLWYWRSIGLREDL